MKINEKKRQVIKNALTTQEMKEAEERFIKGENPVLSIEEARKRANRKKSADLA